MTVSVSTMFIPVHDPDAALGFYRDALGLEVRNDVAAEGFRWVTVGTPGQDVDIVLSQPHGGRSQAEGDALLTLVTQGSLQAAIFRADDLDSTFEKVRASGAEVLQEPTSQPWGATRRAIWSASPRLDSYRPSRRHRRLERDLAPVGIANDRLCRAPVLRREGLDVVENTLRIERLHVGDLQHGMHLQRRRVALGDEHVGTARRMHPLPRPVIGLEDALEAERRPERSGGAVVTCLDVEAVDALSRHVGPSFRCLPERYSAGARPPDGGH